MSGVPACPGAGPLPREESGASSLSRDWSGVGAGGYMYMCWSIFCILKSKLVDPILSCKLEPVHGRAPACLCTCSSWGRKVEHPHSQGLSEVRGLAGVHTCTGQLSLNICHILMLMLGSLSLLCRISYHIISYHIIAPTLAPNPTHPCCMPPIYRKPSPKRGKSALKTTLTNIYIKSTNIVKTPGEIITNCTGCMCITDHALVIKERVT